MDKNVKEIVLILENCEVINVPIECIKILNVDMEDIVMQDKDISIKNLDLLIQNNGEICGTFNKKTNPIKRLNDCNDITSITYVYESGKRITFRIDWVYKDDNPYVFEQENQAQTSEMIDYKTIHININPNNVKYSLKELFDFPVGSKFKTKDGQTVKVEEGINDEKEIRLTKSMTNQFFYKVN